MFLVWRYLDEGISRALGNLGRSYAKAGNFKKAIDLWSEKIPLCRDESEKSWLYHEMGYCYLTVADYSMANQCGIMSYEAAQDATDYDWQINSCVLIAQALGKNQCYVTSGLNNLLPVNSEIKNSKFSFFKVNVLNSLYNISLD